MNLQDALQRAVNCHVGCEVILARADREVDGRMTIRQIRVTPVPVPAGETREMGQTWSLHVDANLSRKDLFDDTWDCFRDGDYQGGKR